MSPAAGTSAGAPATTPTVWLCRPEQADDPCAASLTATSIPASGARVVEAASDAPDPAADCFYVYPTVSKELADNADLRIQPAERDVAVAEAARFSSVCRVWAPMYRQRTELSIAKGLDSDPAGDDRAYQSLLSAWDDYLAHDNEGRPIAFSGHSQGAAMLIRLLASEVDPQPARRSRTVVASLAGANVAVPNGATVGGTFQHLPLCTMIGRPGCVIAYSSFPSEPPPGSPFGRPGQGVSLQSGQRASAGLQVACVDPADPARAEADLAPYFLTATSTPPGPPVSTPWVTYPGLYRAECRTGGGASWLQVTPRAADGRPVVDEALGPDWGYHLDDIDLALGDLVTDVKGAVDALERGH